MSERRSRDRRDAGKVPEAIERKRERREDDRRESPRVPMAFLIRDLAEGGSYEEREGDLSIGGIFWKGRTPAAGKEVEVRFRLPGVSKEVRALGEIIRVSNETSGIDFHVRFTELDVQSELAIAKFLDDNL